MIRQEVLNKKIEGCLLKYDKEIQNVITWARSHMDSKDYRLRCLGFVEDAYERSNGIEMCVGAAMLASPLKFTESTRILVFHQKELLFSIPVLAWWKAKYEIGDT
ncbi:hypothetical protein FE784_24700 [Paenibacillus hemerocallicola]|uniref:Uncharacterized protein n=1 Tax=Paenibacillus hemerocallicola TaxID=1172614 RepID=A0A5C4T3K4_9BACL|nr:hypothetical protein FE784_24700 [Paenibacillus hemerocallicola]